MSGIKSPLHRTPFVGEVREWPLDRKLPDGWIWPGGTLSREEYPELFKLYSEWGFPYGTGDGKTTFGTPPLFVSSSDVRLGFALCVRGTAEADLAEMERKMPKLRDPNKMFKDFIKLPPIEATYIDVISGWKWRRSPTNDRWEEGKALSWEELGYYSKLPKSLLLIPNAEAWYGIPKTPPSSETDCEEIEDDEG